MHPADPAALEKWQTPWLRWLNDALLPAMVVQLTAGALAAAPTDWPHPRGPRLNGTIVDGALADQWPAEGPPVVWRRSIGQGYSGCIIVDGRIYTQFQTAAGQHVGCFDLDSGREIWRTRYGLPWQLDGDWPGPYATPVHAGAKVYFAGCYGRVGCVRARDGKRLWTVDLQRAFAGKGTEFGYGCAPLVEDGRVYLPVGGEGASVVALDAATGRLIWKSGSDPASYCGSIAIDVQGRRQIVSYLQNITVAHDPQTGRELWRHTRGHGYAEHAAWPIWQPPYLFYSEPFREGSKVLRLDYADDLPRMSVVWQSDVLCNDIFSSVVVDGHIYGFDLLDYQAVFGGESDGHFKCVELATGREKWATTNTGHAMVLTDQNRLVIFNERGELILADATPAEYRERARARIFEGAQCWIAPAFYDGRLLLRAKGQLACVYLGPADAGRLGELKRLAVTDVKAPAPGALERFRGDAYFAPTLGDLNRWFWFSLLGVALPASGLALLARRAAPPALSLGAASLAGGLSACPLLTGWAEQFVFTWPVALHAVYFAATGACVRAAGGDGSRDAWIARASLLGLAGACALYYLLCQRYFIVMGWGFLVGILPALPVTLFLQWNMRTLTPAMLAGPLVVSWTVSFAVFYWSAAVFVLFKTG